MAISMRSKKGIFILITTVALALSAVDCASNNTPNTPALAPEESSTVSFQPAAQPAVAVTWGYLGDRGPEFWHYLDPSFYMVKEGKAQSPIDINTLDLVSADGLERPVFYYRNTRFILYDDGHTIEAVPKTPDNTITLDGRNYVLQHFEFHTPSEHTIDGREAAMEIHFFHKDDAGNTAIVSVLVDEGEENRILKEAFSYLSWVSVGGTIELDKPIDLGRLFDDTVPLYRYEGSLTTPPCTEGVKWNIYSRTITAAKYQIESFMGLYTKNSRPVQNLNGRTVYITR
jgi:carbonic anhydrase